MTLYPLLQLFNLLQLHGNIYIVVNKFYFQFNQYCSKYNNDIKFRIILPIKRISLSEKEYTQPIPSLSEKQFVVSKGPKGTVEQERLALALFWYREKLLQKIKAIWESVSFYLFYQVFV